MDLIGSFIAVFRKSLPDFKYTQNFRDNNIIFFSKILNQIICIKYSKRKHYIHPNLAHKYMERSRRDMQRKLGLDFYRRAYILNVFIADNLTSSCFKMVKKPELQNMDMIFCTKHLVEERIVSTVLKALSNKLTRWHNGIVTSVRNSNVDSPYGIVKEQLNQIDLANELMQWSSYHMDKKGYRRQERN